MKRGASVLLVDDCPEALQVLAGEFTGAGYRISTAQDGKAAWQIFHDEPHDLVVTDVRMPKANGFDLLRQIREVSNVPVILLTAYGEIPLAVSAIRHGAEDYLRYPDDLERLLPRARELLKQRGPIEPRDAATDLLIGSSRPMRQLRRQLRALAPLDVPVLMCGEPGSGRKLAIEALHALSPIHAAPVVRFGASDASPGEPHAILLEDAERLTVEDQERWLRSGGQRSDAPILRVYATCHPISGRRSARAGLDAMLTPELSKFPIWVPPLRERLEDVPELAAHFAREATRSLGRKGLTLARGATRPLDGRSWPENVLELREVVERAAAFASGKTLDAPTVESALQHAIDRKRESLEQRRAAHHTAEREELVQLLDACGGNVAEMARRLDLTRGAIVYRLKKHGLMR
jgi:two-component system response regulator HydG